MQEDEFLEKGVSRKVITRGENMKIVGMLNGGEEYGVLIPA
jgi:hypothetical protein